MPSERELVERTIDDHFGTTEAGRRDAYRTMIPVVVYLPDMICVALKPDENTIGAEFTTCFSRSDHSIVISHREGE